MKKPKMVIRTLFKLFLGLISNVMKTFYTSIQSIALFTLIYEKLLPIFSVKYTSVAEEKISSKD